MLPGRISDRGSSMLVRRVVIASTPSRSALRSRVSAEPDPRVDRGHDALTATGSPRGGATSEGRALPRRNSLPVTHPVGYLHRVRHTQFQGEIHVNTDR